MKEEKIPSLTEKIRIFALGGLDEDGKNLFCVEVDESIYVIEAGIKFPDNKESLGIEFIIQDFTYLVENKNRVAGIFITHGHDDVMGALPYLLKQVPCDVYTAPLAVKEVQKMIRQEHITGVRVHSVKRNDKKRIGKRRVVFFPITHAYPGTFGLAIGTDQGYIVYSGEFIEDYDVDAFVTGDLKFHTALDSKNIVFDIGHFESEIDIVKTFYDILKEKIPTFAVQIEKKNNNLVYYY